MFPIPWNKLFRKKDGTITTIDEAISSGGGGGGGYTLPTASANTKGGIKIGSGLRMDGEVLSVDGGGGGASLSYVDYTYASSQSITANSWSTAASQFKAPAALVGHKIVSLQIVQSNSTKLVCAGTFTAVDTIEESTWIIPAIYNSSSSAATVTKIRIFYL